MCMNEEMERCVRQAQQEGRSQRERKENKENLPASRLVSHKN